jgi:hypothetical protein
MSGNQHALAETGATVQQDLVERRTFLMRVHRHHVVFDGNADAAHVEADEVRGQHDERLAVLAIEVFPAFERDQSANAFFGTPPQDAVLKDSSPKDAKVPAR